MTQYKLQASEDIAKARRAKDGQGLSDDWEDMRKQREKQQMDDAERARQLVRTPINLYTLSLITHPVNIDNNEKNNRWTTQKGLGNW